MTDYLKAKPDSVVYYGDKKSTASWQLLYFIALKLIAAKHPDELMRLEGKSILGDKIEIGSEIEIREFSHPLGIMRKPDGKWLFAETDFNVQQILLRLKKLMEICKDPLDTMVIYFSANQSQNVSLRTDKSDSPLIRKSLAEIFRPKVPKATPTVTTAEQQYVQWLIQKGEKPSEAQAAFSMTEKVINRLQISAKRLFSVTSAVELKYILSALRRTPQWHYFSSRQQNQIVHTIDLYTPARFLGFDVRVRRDASVKRSGKRKMRTMNNKVELNIPLKDKVETYLLSHSIAKRDGKRLIPIHRPILLNRTDLEIVMIYNAELRGLCNYYAIASNFNKLVYFGYLMEYSCLKTLANKHRSRIAKVRYEYRDGTGAWGVPYETKKGKRRMMFAKYSDCKGKDLTEKVPDLAYRYSHNTTSFEERLKAKVCEVCGCTDSDSYEIHHVNKVKNLKGKADWEKVMLAKRRKTIVVCHKCHMRIHHGTKTE